MATRQRLGGYVTDLATDGHFCCEGTHIQPSCVGSKAASYDKDATGRDILPVANI